MAFELDHVFVASEVGGPEIRHLTSAGFVEGPARDHPGQGTASRGIFFENAYLELIWLVEREAANREPVGRTGLAQRADPTSGASPFGFGLRATQAPVPSPPFDVWPYSPAYLPEGTSFGMASNSVKLDEPLVFVLPWARTPSWDLPRHPNGARRITRVSLSSTPPTISEEFSQFLRLGLAFLDPGEVPLMRIELDEGTQGNSVDLRPHLPVILYL